MAHASAAHFAYLRRLAFTREVQQIAVKFVKYGSAAYVFRTYVMGVTACTGPSMFPTLNTRGDTPLLPVSLPFFNIKGDLILLEHFSVFAKTIKVGDVITAYSVQNPRHVVCKRVLGLEGDLIRVPWSSTNGPARTVKVPEGHVWLQGDNTLNSTDSRHYGPVPYALLNGKAFLKAGALICWMTQRQVVFWNPRLGTAKGHNHATSTAQSREGQSLPAQAGRQHVADMCAAGGHWCSEHAAWTSGSISCGWWDLCADCQRQLEKQCMCNMADTWYEACGLSMHNVH